MKVRHKTPGPIAIAQDSTAIHETSTPRQEHRLPKLGNEQKIIFRNRDSGKKRNYSETLFLPNLWDSVGLVLGRIVIAQSAILVNH